MSVIAGLIRFSGASVYQGELEIAAARLKAPGVGEPQYWINGSAAMLVRQRIVTPEDRFERQPWVGGCRHMVLVYDGRIDNREELAAALGISLKDEVVPDGRLLLMALERWGEAALPRLIGDFALALWETQSRRLLLARDQMGGRTLYYYHGSGFVAFATTYPALLALPGVPGKLDELGIADWLICNGNHPVQTLYEGVRRVPAASAAVFDGNAVHLNQYWTLKPRCQLRLSSDQEYVEAMREQLDRAVACRLRSAAPVAALMTGGLDSSAVAATAAGLLLPARLTTITSVPPDGVELPLRNGAYNDERPYIDAIAARHCNMDSLLFSTLESHWTQTEPADFFEAGGLPVRAITNIGWFMPGYERIAADSISVLLNGEGGNGAWSWDGLHTLHGMFRRGRWLRLARELGLAGRNRPYGRGWYALLRGEVLRSLMPNWRRRNNGDMDARLSYSAINPEFCREIGIFERCREAGRILPNAARPPGTLTRRLYLLKICQDLGDIATVMRAVTGVESRAPLLDIRLLEFCLSIPDEQFFKDGMHRRLTRTALADRLPSPVLKNGLIGIQNPEIMHRMKDRRNDVIDEIEALKGIPLAARCIDLPRLSAIAREWPNSQQVSWVLPIALHFGKFLRWAEQKGL